MKRSFVMLVIVLSACGGGTRTATSPQGSAIASPTGPGPRAYAAGMCKALLDWKGSVEASSASLQSQLSSVQSLEEAKRIFTDYLHVVVRDTDSMISRVREVGAPAVASGRDIHRKMGEGLDTIRASFAKAESEAGKLPTNDPAAFTKGTEQILSSVDSEISGIDNTLDFEPAGLTQAFDSEPSCQKLTSMSG
jgi:hypothetical protein